MKNPLLYETLRIAVGGTILSLAAIIIFLLLKQFDSAVLLGFLIGNLLANANFFLMGLSLKKAIGQSEENVKPIIKLSYKFRMIGFFVIVAIILYLNIVNSIAILLPLFFSRLIIIILNLVDKNNNEQEVADG